MKRLLFFAACLIVYSNCSFSQATDKYAVENNNYELSFNGFRNPSIGMEIKYKVLSLHAGYYLTVVPNDENSVKENTAFIRTGLSHWFNILESLSAYVSASYLYGLSKSYEDVNAYMIDAGLKLFIWKGLNVRLGVAGLISPGHKLKINPTPGISYSLLF